MEAGAAVGVAAGAAAVGLAAGAAVGVAAAGALGMGVGVGVAAGAQAESTRAASAIPAMPSQNPCLLTYIVSSFVSVESRESSPSKPKTLNPTP